MKKSRWALYIDIEGFSQNYEYNEERKTFAIYALRELMNAIYNIGTRAYPGKSKNNFSERLFAHQFGDGFVIVSDFYESNAERCIAISISLIRHMMMKGFAVKASISTGGMSDINGCYPKAINCSKSGRANLGMGLMTTTSVMGKALTRSYKLSNKKSGCLIIIDATRFEYLPEINKKELGSDIYTVDWVSTDLNLARNISELAKLEYGTNENITKMFDNYILQEPTPPLNWIKSTLEAWH